MRARTASATPSPWPLWLAAAALLIAGVSALAWTRPAMLMRDLLAAGISALCDPPDGVAQREAALVQAQEDEAQLRRDLSALEDESLRRRAACRQPAPAPQVAELPPPPARPAAPAPPAAPEALPPLAAAPAAPSTPPAPRVDLPAERWAARDIRMLEGCWTRYTNMQVIEAGTGQVRRVRRWRLCFDANGNGTQELVWSDGTVCRAPVRARFGNDDRLEFTDQGIPCSNGARIFAQVARCTRNADGTARCAATQPQGGSDESLFKR